MKIYFAGSIRGGRADVDTYFELITLLNQKHKVLTEFVGDKGLTILGSEHLSDSQILTRDKAWIDECDVLVAEVSTPSLGVGYEIAYAESIGKKIVCLYREQEGKKLSAMIAGIPSIEFCYYNDKNEVIDFVRKRFC